MAEIDIVVECGFKFKKDANFAKDIIKEYSGKETAPENFKVIELKLLEYFRHHFGEFVSKSSIVGSYNYRYWINKAASQIDSGKFKEAIDSSNRALELEQDAPQALINKGTRTNAYSGSAAWLEGQQQAAIRQRQCEFLRNPGTDRLANTAIGPALSQLWAVWRLNQYLN